MYSWDRSDIKDPVSLGIMDSDIISRPLENTYFSDVTLQPAFKDSIALPGDFSILVMEGSFIHLNVT